MKIAFDGQWLLNRKRTGIAWNAHNMIRELAKYTENECVIQCFTLHASQDQMQEIRKYQELGCRVECCNWFHNALYKLVWVVLPVPHRIFFREKADITQFFNFVVPPGVRGKRVTVVHDMAYMDCPETVDKKTRSWLRISMKKSCCHADHIITVSQYSKQQIMRHLHVPSEQITVIPNAVDHTVYRADYSKRQIQGVLDRYGIDREYFLYLGTIEPRKNLERLVDAYAILCSRNEHVPRLVLAGGKGWLCEGVYKKVEELQLEDQVVFTGYVKQEDSPVLMCGALTFVFPSLYEGFGMPPLEAMACGTPVIVSNSTSLPEVVGDAGIAVDPLDTEQLHGAMQRLISDAGLREQLRAAGLRRAQSYTWERSAAMLMDVYRELYRDRRR